MPSTAGNKFLEDSVEVGLKNISYTFNIYDTSLGRKWIESLRDNLVQKRVLEKNFCFLGFADSKRNLNFLCQELNKSIEQINSFQFEPPYEKIDKFVANDFQYSDQYTIGQTDDEDKSGTLGLRLKHESCNQLHRYFEDLQGTAWKLSPFYKQADSETKYAIRQLNNICHEIEGWVEAYRKNIIDPEWVRSAQITTFLNAPRYQLTANDLELFKKNRYRRELGGVYLHWSQVGKTLFEVFRDEGGKKLDAVTCSAINHQRFYSGEFDVEWGATIDEGTFDWKKKEMDEFREWLKLNEYDWNDTSLALGYAKIGQVDLERSFGTSSFLDINKILTDNLDIRSIKIISDQITEQTYSYTLDSDDWQKIQKNALSPGYKIKKNDNGK